MEPLSIATAIVSVLKGIGSAYTFIESLSRADPEAQQVARQLQAAKAILKALKTSLETVYRPPEFLDIWNEPAQLVLSNMRTTIKQLNKKLGRGTAVGSRLGFRQRTSWVLGSEETRTLQQHLYGYLQMLSVVQNALLQ